MRHGQLWFKPAAVDGCACVPLGCRSVPSWYRMFTYCMQRICAESGCTGRPVLLTWLHYLLYTDTSCAPCCVNTIPRQAAGLTLLL